MIYKESETVELKKSTSELKEAIISIGTVEDLTLKLKEECQ